MPTSTPDRISCAGLVRIVLDGKILATLNKNRLKKGTPVYTPPGGSYHLVGKSTLNYLKEHLGLVPEQGIDMRFPLQGSPEKRKYTLKQFSLWFASRQGRETNPSRELYEELVCEDPILCRDKHVFPRLTLITGNSTYRYHERSSRGGQEDKVTEYFLELFEAHLTKHSRAHLRRTLKGNYPHVNLLTLDEIAEGRTRESISFLGSTLPVPIASSFQCFLKS